ncbi:MAG: prolipoprotein diacylglyceryl transferase [Eubacteriales bacterium]|nr:prolipoprotein diacylglyceryl transferase [Eubacteriales bacterium]
MATLTVLGREIPLYSLLTVAGALLAWGYVEWRARRLGHQNTADVELSFLYGMIGAFLGAKLLSVLTQIPAIRADWPLLSVSPSVFMQKYLYAGFVFYGGILGALLASWCYCRTKHIAYADMERVLLPICPLIHAFGRVGCFLTGCCYGKSVPWGYVYHHSAVAPNGVPLLPVQLFEAGFEVILCLIAILLSKKERRGGTLTAIYLGTYGIFRFIIEFWRGDAYRGFIGPLSVSQWIALATLLGIALWLIRKNKKTA